MMDVYLHTGLITRYFFFYRIIRTAESKAKVCVVKCDLSFFTSKRKKRFRSILTIRYLPFSKAGSIICWHLIWTYLSSHFCPSHKVRLRCSSWTSRSCRDHYTPISVVKEDLCIWVQLLFIFWLIDDDFPWGHCPVCPFLFPGTRWCLWPSTFLPLPFTSILMRAHLTFSLWKTPQWQFCKSQMCWSPSTQCSLLGNGPWEQEKWIETSSFLWPSLCLKSHFDFEDLSVLIPKERDLDQPISKFLRALTI